MILGFMTRRELLDQLTEARRAIQRLAAENYHLHRAVAASQRTVEACNRLIKAYEDKEIATENFLAVLQGEQIATNDIND